MFHTRPKFLNNISYAIRLDLEAAGKRHRNHANDILTLIGEENRINRRVYPIPDGNAGNQQQHQTMKDDIIVTRKATKSDKIQRRQRKTPIIQRKAEKLPKTVFSENPTKSKTVKT